MITLYKYGSFRSRLKKLFSLKGFMVSSLVLFVSPIVDATENECLLGQKLLEKRGKLIEVLNKMGTKPSPKEVCSKFTPLIENGNSLLAWVRKEKEWCQIPDDFIDRITIDHKQALKILKQACSASQAPAQPKMPTLDNPESPSQPHDDKNQLTAPIPVPQGIPLK